MGWSRAPTRRPAGASVSSSPCVPLFPLPWSTEPDEEAVMSPTWSVQGQRVQGMGAAATRGHGEEEARGGGSPRWCSGGARRRREDSGGAPRLSSRSDACEEEARGLRRGDRAATTRSVKENVGSGDLVWWRGSSTAAVRSGGVQGRWKRRIDGLGRPVVGLAEPIHIFFFFFVFSIRFTVAGNKPSQQRSHLP